MTVEDVTRILGTASPVAAATAVYALFAFLDSKASSEAQQALGGWIRNENYSSFDLAIAVQRAFDNLYGRRLLSFQGLIRSAAFSIIAFSLYMLITMGFEDCCFELELMFGTLLPFIIISDYISLFVVRSGLALSRTYLPASIGVVIIGAAMSIELAGTMFQLSNYVLDQESYRWNVGKLWTDLKDTLAEFPLELLTPPLSWWTRLVPAVFVHLWIPLLLIGALANMVINGFFRATKFAQWFLKRGSQHPLEAIGMTASVFAFFGVAAWRVAYLFFFGNT